MATILDALKGVNAYPIPFRTILEVGTRRGLDLEEDMSVEQLRGSSFCLAKADLLLWLSYAPDVSQGGQSYSFTDEQRLRMRREANQLYDEFGEDGAVKTLYGYKGKRL